MAKFILQKILKNIFCILICIVFVLSAVVIPFYYSITGLTKPETITQFVQNIDYKTVIEETPVINSTLKKYNIDSSTADRIMKSKKTGELIEIYADEATEILLNIPKDRMFDIPLIKEIVDENIDEFVAIAEENTGKNYSEKKIKNNVDTFIEKNEKQVKKALPILETTRTVVKTVHESKVIEKTLSTEFIIFLSLFALLLCTLIFVFKRRNGFIYMGINCFISGVFLMLIIIFNQNRVVSHLALKLSNFNAEIIESAISICTEKITIAFCTMALGSFVFLVLFIIISRIKDKRGNVKSSLEENSQPAEILI